MCNRLHVQRYYGNNSSSQSTFVAFMGALSYSAIKENKSPSSLLSSHYSINGHHSIKKPVIAFRCRVK